MNTVNESVVTNEPKELVALCRAGRLYDIEKSMAAGKSLDVSAATKRGRQRSLLEIAVETGFHSLVELIAKRDNRPIFKRRRSRGGSVTPSVRSRGAVTIFHFMFFCHRWQE
jgi:hypothetical protein